jgi:peptide/nickel transport system permease protein
MMTEAEIDMMRARYDLDKSVFWRYGKYMMNLVQGDLGVSESTGRSVWREFAYGFPFTLRLSFLILIIGVAIAIPLGIFAAKHAGTVWDSLTTGFTLIGMSMPSFWVGLLLIMLFSARLNWLPAVYTEGNLLSYLMPGVTGGLMLSATITRQTRSAMLENARADFTRTARAKGVPERQITWKHTLKYAWIPIVTQIGITLGRTLAGSAVVEMVYSWPGIGKLTVMAVAQRDTTMACGVVILTCIMYVFVLLMVDLVYALVDPRIKAQYQSKGKGKARRKLA